MRMSHVTHTMSHVTRGVCVTQVEGHQGDAMQEESARRVEKVDILKKLSKVSLLPTTNVCLPFMARSYM